MTKRLLTTMLLLGTLVGCGNYYNEDLAFYAALPPSEQLQVNLPKDSAAPTPKPGQQLRAVSLGDPAEIYAATRQASDAINDEISKVLRGIARRLRTEAMLVDVAASVEEARGQELAQAMQHKTSAPQEMAGGVAVH